MVHDERECTMPMPSGPSSNRTVVSSGQVGDDTTDDEEEADEDAGGSVDCVDWAAAAAH